MKEDIFEMHAIMRGHVQGVFFRATTREFARKLGLSGTVRNVPDGTVEIFAQGTKENLEKLLEFLLGDEGPGHVEECNKVFSKPIRKLLDFKIVH